jgi:hypothetical protein
MSMVIVALNLHYSKEFLQYLQYQYHLIVEIVLVLIRALNDLMHRSNNNRIKISFIERMNKLVFVENPIFVYVHDHLSLVNVFE